MGYTTPRGVRIGNVFEVCTAGIRDGWWKIGRIPGDWEHVSALGRHLQLERLRVITVQLPCCVKRRNVLREQEAGDDGNSRYVSRELNTTFDCGQLGILVEIKSKVCSESKALTVKGNAFKVSWFLVRQEVRNARSDIYKARTSECLVSESPGLTSTSQHPPVACPDALHPTEDHTRPRWTRHFTTWTRVI
ncbi:hypothetical protein AAG570_004198 [Ranatra chinensis]|uniref:Uncharacterized protein n=1 Tax=Ranatra chinensis TaxID=642074 RepID=A0ABD0Y4D6_9HEMI